MKQYKGKRKAIRSKRKGFVPILGLLFALTALFAVEPAGTGAVYTNTKTITNNTITAHSLGTPGVLSATWSSPNIVLNWTLTSDSKGLGYRIERSANGSSGWAPVAYVSSVATSWTDTTPLPGGNYYRIYTIRHSWTSAGFRVSSASKPLATTGVINTGAGSTTTNVSYSWSAITGATSYQYRWRTRKAEVGEPSSSYSAWTATTNLNVELTAPAGHYFGFEVRGVDSRGAAGPALEGPIGFNIPVLTPTTIFTANELVDHAGKKTSLHFDYDHSSTGRSIQAQIQTDGGAWTTLNSVDFTNWGGTNWWYGTPVPAPGKTYNFRARTCNDSGCSGWINILNYRPSYFISQWSLYWKKFVDAQSKYLFYERMTAPAYPDYTWVGYHGTQGVNWWTGECPPFRSCSGTDKSIRTAGTDGYIYRSHNIAGEGNYPGNAARTWVFFHKKAAGTWAGNQYLAFHASSNDALSSSWGLRTSPTANRFTWANGQTFPGVGKLNDGNWHQYVISYNGSTVTLYEDGVSLGSVSAAINTSNSKDLYLGGADNGSIARKPGWWDEWAVMAGAVTSAEVSELWSARADGD